MLQSHLRGIGTSFPSRGVDEALSGVPNSLLSLLFVLRIHNHPRLRLRRPNKESTFQMLTPLSITVDARVTLLGEGPRAALAGLLRRLSRRSYV